jgi:hypothetical protein
MNPYSLYPEMPKSALSSYHPPVPPPRQGQESVASTLSLQNAFMNSQIRSDIEHDKELSNETSKDMVDDESGRVSGLHVNFKARLENR